MIRVERLQGEALARALPDVARLRIEVFRDWPYLYDGDMAYEEAYLQVYREAEDAVLVAAFDGDDLVGASTGAPMLDHAEDFGAAFGANSGVGHPGLDQIFYCAESVLLPVYRGQGIGHRFFDVREAHGRALGLRYAAFCAVMRPTGHPLQPEDYRPLDAFWRKRGYAPLKGVAAQFSWKDLDEVEESQHLLQFWMRAL
ncbi:MAG: GNAT family N-acetyltransferase [Pseudomonadota bacterium]